MAQEELAMPVEARMRHQAPADVDLALTETQNWGSHSHRALYEAVHTNNDPGQAGSLADEWARMGQEMNESAQVMSERLRATETGWQGEAATAARGAIHQLADWNGTAAQTAVEVGNRIADQGRIMETARAAMPEPVEFDWKSTLIQGFATGGLAGFATAVNDVKVKSDQANTAHQQAVTVMTNMENDSRTVDSATPRFTPPPDPVNGGTVDLLRRQAIQERVLEAPQAPTGGEVLHALRSTLEADASGGGGGNGSTSAQFTGGQPSMPGVPSGAGGGGMPGLDAYKPGGTTAQGTPGAPSAPHFAPSNTGMPGINAYKPSSTTPQGAPGAPSIPPLHTGMPGINAYKPSSTTPQGAPGAPSIPPLSTGIPRTGGNDGTDRPNRQQMPPIPPGFRPGDPRGGRPGIGGPSGPGAPGSGGRPNPPPFTPPNSPNGGRPFQPPFSGPGAGGRPGMPPIPPIPPTSGSGGGAGGGGFGGPRGGFGPAGPGAPGEFGPRGSGAAAGAMPGAGRVPGEGTFGGRGAPGVAGQSGTGGGTGMGGMGGGRSRGAKTTYVVPGTSRVSNSSRALATTCRRR